MVRLNVLLKSDTGESFWVQAVINLIHINQLTAHVRLYLSEELIKLLLLVLVQSQK